MADTPQSSVAADSARWFSFSRLLRTLLLVGIVVALTGFALGAWSRRDAATLPSGVDEPCASSGNCVSSLSKNESAIAAIKIDGDANAAWAKLLEVARSRATRTRETTDTTLHAEFDSSVFGFRDDLWLRLDREAKRIDVRSSSRVGKSDLGANRARVESLRAVLAGR